MIALTEVSQTTTGEYTVRSVYVNPSQVVMIREDSRYRFLVKEGKLSSLGFHDNVEFSRITIRGGTSNYDITVAGSAPTIYEKMNYSKSLLKG
jgi:hypothetical protein